ncbi:MAG: site-2 protease family protein [Planctomycetota bacterium]
MFLSEPGTTGYDIRFQLFGHSVRIHPFFFVLPLLFGSGLAMSFGFADNLGVGLILVSIIFFISILVHEFGHALAFRYNGVHSKIVLYLMGGLAIPERHGWGKRTVVSSNQKMFISFAGPLAGFLLAGLLVLIGLAIGGTVAKFTDFGFIPVPFIQFDNPGIVQNQSVRLLINGGILINVFLNVLNLVPVFPLDGGQIAREFLMQMDPRDGQRNALYLSIATAVVIGIVGLMNRQTFLAIMFGLLAFENYQMMQRFGGGSRW